MSKDLLSPSQAHEKANAPQKGMLLIVGSVTLGAYILTRRPSESTAVWVIAGVAVLSAIGGAIYHPVRRFWLRGLVAGVVVGICALVATLYYIEMRFKWTGWVNSIELLLPLFIGSAPGIALYVQMMSRQTITDAEAEALVGRVP